MKFAKTYEPNLFENDIYALWEKANAFAPAEQGEPYSIVMPPPNANGTLHVGHSMMIAIQDIVIRFQRLRGKRALYVPGADHAGFETQVVFERELAKEGKSRFDFSREDLYRQIWDFVADSRETFNDQLRRLGASADWNAFTFTLDDRIIERSYKTFKKLWDDGYIYRGERLVNFCTFHGTAFADIEVEHQEEQGSIWHIRYALTDGSGEIVVATTRPETLFGDVAVAVHPEDERYSSYIGKTVRLPLTEREIPIITDDFVDRSFGTGAVKITPAHDPNDFAVGERHDLPKITVISNHGTLIDVPAPYRDLTVEEGRKAAVEALEAQGYLVETQAHTHNVGHCYKCGTVIQPLLREQWFVNTVPLAGPAIQALETGAITFHPDSRRKQLITYLENLRDWNISRQIAWGIPIPAFQNVDDPADWVYDERTDQEFIEVNDKTYRRDPDVFDTWFSSSSWPYATIDYPEDAALRDFYPNALMETGFDILYPWVSRMIMFGLYATGEVPFKDVYLHGLVLDQHGQKMSKSKGNVINPIDVVNEYGSDALRMGIISGTTAGINQPYSPPKVIGARNFANKLWNIARYISDIVGDDFRPSAPHPETPADHWVLDKLQHTTDRVAVLLEEYRFSEAYETLYHFVWDDVADWYIEASKAGQNREVLAYVLESVLTIAHPFAPFVTETIWQALGWREQLLIGYHWPKHLVYDRKQARQFEELRHIITEIRYISQALNVRDLTLYHSGSALIAEHMELIKRLAKLQSIIEVADGSGVFLTETNEHCWLGIDAASAEAYAKELAEKITAKEQEIARLEGRLQNTSYVANAPKQVVDETRQALEASQHLLGTLKNELERFTY